MPRILSWQGAKTATLFDSREAGLWGLHKEKHGQDILENQTLQNVRHGLVFNQETFFPYTRKHVILVFNVVVGSPC